MRLGGLLVFKLLLDAHFVSVEVTDTIDTGPDVRLGLEQYLHESCVIATPLLCLKASEDFHYLSKEPITALLVELSAIEWLKQALSVFVHEWKEAKRAQALRGTTILPMTICNALDNKTCPAQTFGKHEPLVILPKDR